MKRICVFGAGAVGGYMAAALARAGRDVSIIARGRHLEHIKAAGLTVRNASGQFSVNLPASDNMLEFEPFDIVIITAKAPSLPAIARQIAPHVRSQTAILFATNGVQWFYGDEFSPGGLKLDTRRLDQGDELHRLIGAEQSFGVVVRSTNSVPEPGIVYNSGAGTYILGSGISRNAGWADDVASVLDVEGAAFNATNDIRRAMWTKLIRNATIALLCGLTHATPGLAFSDPTTAPLAVSVMREVAKIAEAHGFFDLIDVALEMDVVGRMTAMKPSMVQDIELGRPIELDAQVLILLDFAKQAKVLVPTLATLAPILEQKARLAGCYN